MFTKSIAWKLRTSIGALVLVLSGAAVFLILALGSAGNGLRALVEGPYRQELAVCQSRIEVLQFARDLRDYYIQTGSGTQLGTVRNFEEKIARDRAALDQAMEAVDGAALADYRAAVDSWLAVGEKIISALSVGNRGAAEPLILNDCPAALDRVKALSEQVADECAAAVAGEVAHRTAVTRTAWIISAAVLVLAVALAAVLSRRLRQSILPPLQELRGQSDELARGNLHIPVTHRSEDEFGALADGMRASQAALSAYIADISRAMRELSGGNFNIAPSQEFLGDFAEIERSITRFVDTMSAFLRRVREFAGQVKYGMEQVSSGAQNLAQGTAEQAEAIEEIAGSLSGASRMVSDNAHQATEASAEAEGAGSQITLCGQKMDAMTEAMGEIEDAVDQIRKILASIEDIAVQTNLLSLNAAVEAAHAGAAGKGFAVVADEVRKLAAKSAEASRRTAELIERTVRSVRSGSNIATDTSAALYATMDSVRRTADMLSAISAASQEQADLLAQVSTGVEQISAVIQNNSATAQESAAASQELAGLTESMEKLVDTFRPKE